MIEAKRGTLYPQIIQIISAEKRWSAVYADAENRGMIRLHPIICWALIARYDELLSNEVREIVGMLTDHNFITFADDSIQFLGYINDDTSSEIKAEFMGQSEFFFDQKLKTMEINKTGETKT